MGYHIEVNDTLQIKAEQGFPAELNWEKHQQTPLKAADFAGKVFSFQNKAEIRLYPMPPVRTFLVENRGGKWLYWGLIDMVSVHYDYLAKTTSGSYTIRYINTPIEMQNAYAVLDQRPDYNFFSNLRK